MLNDYQQIHTLLEDKKHILITFQKDAGADAIAGSIAIANFLESLNKRVDIVAENFELPKTLNFLHGANKIKSAFSHLQKFIITVDAKQSGVQELSYDIKDDKLRIYITPKQGFLQRDDIQTAQSDFKYDLIFSISTQDLESLGALYENNTELFYSTPIINIDYKPGNEHFGQINIIDITASSTSEVIFNLLKKMGEEYINEEIATALLTGMIAKTQSFKTENVKPNTLALASKLITLGADRDYIIKNLYRTKTINALKLWGQALGHLQSEKNIGLVWTSITRDDFVRSGAAETDLYDIVDELIANSPEAKMTLLIHEHTEDNSIHAILTCEKGRNAKQLLSSLNPQGDAGRTQIIMRDKSLKEAEEKIIEEIKKKFS